jgi:pimeloyl-ACP methyl ester carboxylesterase
MINQNIIFLHGGPGFSNYLEPFFKNLDQSVNAVFYDQIKGETVTIEGLVDQLDSYVNSLEGPIYIVGHSWGATLGLEYVTRFQEKISGFVLMSSGLNFNHWKIEFDLEKERLGLTSASPEMIFLAEQERADWCGFLDGMWDTFSEETFHSLYAGYISSHDLTDKFSKLKLPILSISGSEDVRFCPRIAKSLVTYNPKVEHFEVAGAGHFPFLLESHRRIVLDKISNFIRGGGQ